MTREVVFRGAAEVKDFQKRLNVVSLVDSS